MLFHMAHIPRRGRPKLPAAEKKSVMARVLLTPRQYRKLLRLGGPTWIRERIDEAKD
jgi:hypothetical protein